MQLDTLIHVHIVKWSPQLSYKHYIYYASYILHTSYTICIWVRLYTYMLYYTHYYHTWYMLCIINTMYYIWCTLHIPQALDFPKLLIWHNWNIVHVGQHLPTFPCSKSLATWILLSATVNLTIVDYTCKPFLYNYEVF